MSKWKTSKTTSKVEVYSVPKAIVDELTLKSADHDLLIEELVTGAKQESHAQRALVDLLHKVKDTRNPEARKFWLDRLEAIMIVMSRSASLRDQLLLEKAKYNDLTRDYSDLAEKYRKLLKVKEDTILHKDE